MRSARSVLALVAVLVLGVAGAAPGTDYTWNVSSGNWGDGGSWDLGSAPSAGDSALFDVANNTTVTMDNDYGITDVTVTGTKDYRKWTVNGSASTLTVSGTVSYEHPGLGSEFNAILGGAGTLSVSDGSLKLQNAANTFSGGVSISGGALLQVKSLGAAATVTVSGGGTLWQDAGLTNTVTFNGGKWCTGQTYTTTGSTVLDGNVTFVTGSGNSGVVFTVAGQVTGAGQFIVDISGTKNILKFTASNNDYQGGTLVQNGQVVIAADGALPGTGAVVVNSGADAPYDNGLVLMAEQTVSPTDVTVNAGGAFQLTTPYGDNTAKTYNMPVTLNGGALAGSGLAKDTGHGQMILTGAVTLAADGYFMTSDDSRDKLDITGAITGAGYKVVKSAGMKGPLVLNNAANSYTGGTEVVAGPVEVRKAGGLGTGTVTVTNGSLKTAATGALNSVLNAGNAVAINTDGVIDFGSTELATAGMVVTVDPTAAVRKSGGSTALVYAAGGRTIDLARGAILHSTAAAVAEPALADLAAGDGGYGLYYGRDGTDSSAYSFGDDGAETTIYRGFGVLQLKTLTYKGTATDIAPGQPGIHAYVQPMATFELDGATLNTGKLTVSGPGTFFIDGNANALPAETVYQGSGQCQVDDAGGLPAGKTLTVSGGYFDVDSAGAVVGTVNIAGGASFDIDQNVNTGTFNVKAGGGVSIDNISRITTAGATWTFEPGSQIQLDGSSYTSATMPGAGSASYVLQPYSDATFDANGLQLGESTRVTIGAAADHNVLADTTRKVKSASGPISLATGEATGRLATYDGSTLWIENAINIPTGKLLIGDTNTFSAIDRYGKAFTEISQNGNVQISDRTNVIDEIEIVAGTLTVREPDQDLTDGAQLGGADVRIDAGATLYLDRYGWPPQDWTLTNDLSGAGTVKVDDDGSKTLTLSGSALAPDSGGVLAVQGGLVLSAAAELRIGVVAGADPGQLSVSGNADVSAGALVVALPLPSVDLKPADLGSFTVVSAGGSLTGTFQAVGVSAATDTHWGITADDVQYGSKTAVLVLGADDWTAHPGDAALNDAVDVFDLSALANHYQVPGGVDWGDADFDLNGVVDVFDLAILANNYGWTAGGGESVPEPTTLAVLALGVLAVVRRGRR